MVVVHSHWRSQLCHGGANCRSLQIMPLYIPTLTQVNYDTMLWMKLVSFVPHLDLKTIWVIFLKLQAIKQSGPAFLTSRVYPETRKSVLPRDAMHSAVMRLQVACRSVRFIRYVFHTVWNTSKIISRPNSLRPMRLLTPTWAIWFNVNTPKLGLNMGGVRST